MAGRTEAEPAKAVAKRSADEIEITETVQVEDPPKDDEPAEGSREAIAKKYSENRHKQAREDNQKLYDEQQAQSDPEPEPEPDPEQPVDKSADPVDKSETADKISTEEPEEIAIVVNGRTIMVDKAKVEAKGGVAAYQKEVAVMDGFQANAQRTKELDEWEQRLKEQQAQLQQQTLAPPQVDAPAEVTDPPQPGDQPSVAELATKYRELLLDGEDKKADEVFVQIVSTSQTKQPGLDPATITREAANQAVDTLEKRDYKKSVAEARQQLFDDHPELKTDERLFQSVNNETKLVKRENPTWTPAQVMQKAWENVENWRGGPKPADPEVPDNIDQKQAEKRAMIRPQPTTGRAKAPPPEPRPTNSDYVQKIQKARGQAV